MNVLPLQQLLKNVTLFLVRIFRYALMVAGCTCQVFGDPVTLSTDFTDDSLQRQAMFDVWTIANRISPTNDPNVRSDLKVNLIRMIGGINTLDSNGNVVEDFAFDPCTYNEETEAYEYNWTALLARFNAVINSGVTIHQVVLDQPPWCFQRGYDFINSGLPYDTEPPYRFNVDDKVTKYGNALPPYDEAAYREFIEELIRELIKEFGEETVRSWRFRVGSEIETPDHWKGTEADFINHYKNTAKAVRYVLPGAKVGVHTRAPDFIYQNGNVTNYKGEPIKSFANGLIQQCYENNVPYDFWGISDYLNIQVDDDLNMAGKYDRLFKPLLDHQNWNNAATLDLMEYKTVTSMNSVDGGGTVPCVSTHTDIIELYFTQLFYENAAYNLEHIHRWSNRRGSSDPIGISTLKTMNGQIRYETQVSGLPSVTDNELKAFFGKHPTGDTFNNDAFDILVYNYNENSLEYKEQEEVKLQFTLNQPVGTHMEYRILSYAKENNELQAFLEGEPESGWIKDGFHRYSDPNDSLNSDGKLAFDNFVHTNEATFSTWQPIQTVAPAASVDNSVSMVSVDTTLDSFAFKKYEFRIVPNLDLLVGWENWADTASGENHHVATYKNGADGTTANDSAWSRNSNGACTDETFGSLSKAIVVADNTTDNDNSGGRVQSGPYAGAQSIDFVVDETSGTGAELAYFHFDMVCRGPDETVGTWKLEVLSGSAVSTGVVATGNVMSSWHGNPQDVDVSLLNLVDNFLDANDRVHFRLTISVSSNRNRNVDFDNFGVSKVVSQAYAGLDQVLTDTDEDGFESFNLDGSGSVVSGDASLAEYLWSSGSIPLATTKEANINLPIGAHLITLQVTDSYGAMDSDQLVLTVVPNFEITTNVLAGWDSDWTNTEATTVNSDARAYFVDENDSWQPHYKASSNDGTFGTFLGADPAYSTSSDGNKQGLRADKDVSPAVINFTVTNNSGIARRLKSFHFDAIRRVGSNQGNTTYSLYVVEPSVLTSGLVSTGGIDNSWDPNVLSDYDIDLTNLNDHMLDAGESATFRLEFTAELTGSHLDLDNVAITFEDDVFSIYADVDQNGLPDWWENHYFGSNGQDAGTDSDGDGLTNGDELIAGTVPSEANSVLAIHDFENATNGFILRWESRLDRTYDVLKADSPDSNVWTSISGPLQGTGSEMSFTDNSPFPLSNAFYKIQVIQQ